MGTLVDCERVAVIAMGNLLMKDDGVAIHALQALERQWESNGVEWIDGGTDAWSAMWRARTCGHLVILDAIQGGEAPGTVYRLELGALEVEGPGVSLHDVSLAHLVRFESALGDGFDSVRVVAMEPARIEPGTELSELCRMALPEFMRTVEMEIREMKKQSNHQGVRPC